MKKKSYTALYAVLQALVWGSFGVIISYAGAYFLNNGLSNAAYGVLLGIVSAVSFAVQLLLAELITRFPKLRLQRVLLFLGAVMLVCCCALFFIKLPIKILAAAFCITAVMVQLLPSLVNALGMAGIQNGMNINFGIARGIGSASYAVCTFVTGQIISKTSVRAVPGVYIFLCIILIISAAVFPGIKNASQEKKTAGDNLLKNKRFLLFLLGTTLLYISHNFLCNFLYQVVVNRGGDEGNQGICSAIAAFSELPVMFLFVKMLKKRRCDTWLKLSGIFMFGKVVGCLLAVNMVWLYLAQLMQLLGFALFSVSSVYYAGSVTGKKDIVRAQALLASTCTLSNLVTFVAGGAIVERFNTDTALVCASAAAALGTALLLFCLEKVENPVGTEMTSPE